VQIAGPTKYIMDVDLPATYYCWEDVDFSIPGRTQTVKDHWDPNNFKIVMDYNKEKTT